MRIEKEIKAGTCAVKIADGHVHLQQPDPITSALQWISVTENEFKEIVAFGWEYFAKQKRG